MSESLRAKDIMNPEVLTFREDATVHEVAAYLEENDISGVPLVDRAGKPTGFVSVTDIAQMESRDQERGEGPDELAPTRERGWNRADVKSFHVAGGGSLARDIMTPTVYTIPEETPVSEIAKTMIAGRIHRLLVTRAGRIAGIVTTLDLLKLVAEGRVEAPLTVKAL